MAMAAEAWTPAETDHLDEVANPLIKGFNLLTEHLTDHGKRLLMEELAEAIATGRLEGQGSVTAVIDRWWTSLVLRHQPGFLEALERPWPAPGGPHQSTADLKAELGF